MYAVARRWNGLLLSRTTTVASDQKRIIQVAGVLLLVSMRLAQRLATAAGSAEVGWIDAYP